MPPLIQGVATAIEALLCYFESQEYVQGLNLAVAAQELAATPGLFPGARTMAVAYESYVQLGEVLCGRSTGTTVASLERKVAVLPTLGRLLVTWGLAVAYHRSGEVARAEVMRRVHTRGRAALPRAGDCRTTLPAPNRPVQRIRPARRLSDTVVVRAGPPS